MTTHATSDKQWTEAELDNLTVEGQFRLRGLEVTRLDTFIDAAFAFVLTLLIISFDELPSTFAELMAAIQPCSVDPADRRLGRDNRTITQTFGYPDPSNFREME